MSFDTFTPLAVFAAISTLTPGGATTLATASGARFGFRRSVPLMAGITLGLTCLAAAAAVGLAGLLLAAPALQLAMKIAGSLYLLWLALAIGRSGAPKLEAEMAAPASFLGGALLLWLNPKAWTMAFAAAASFAMLASGPLQLATLLGATLGLASALSLSLWCMAGLVLARALKTERQWRMLNAIMGLALALSVIPMWRN